MNKKIWIALLVLLGVCIAVYFWFATSGTKLSPPGEMVGANGKLEVSVYYHRPSVRGRKIFGTKAENRAEQNQFTFVKFLKIKNPRRNGGRFVATAYYFYYWNFFMLLLIHS